MSTFALRDLFLVPRVVQREVLVESTNVFGDSLLAKAFDKGDTDLFKAALECAWEVLDHHQVLALSGLISRASHCADDYQSHRFVEAI